MTNEERCGSFVRGFFRKLRELNVEAAVLHGGDDHFESKLSDVDFVVERGHFDRLVGLIEAYTRATGWRLCQVLRHEVTGVFCVCSAADDPSCVVALDGCSDYRAFDSLIMTADELLLERRSTSWGGWKVSEENEFKYRLMKAAIKRKGAKDIGSILRAFSGDVVDGCGGRLGSKWGFHLRDWSERSVVEALPDIRKHLLATSVRPGLANIKRGMGRIVHPSGMVVVIDSDFGRQLGDRIIEVFGFLYFRRSRIVDSVGCRMIPALCRSTLLVTYGKVSPAVERIMGGCLLSIARDDESLALEKIAAFLQARSERYEQR